MTASQRSLVFEEFYNNAMNNYFKILSPKYLRVVGFNLLEHFIKIACIKPLETIFKVYYSYLLF